MASYRMSRDNPGGRPEEYIPSRASPSRGDASHQGEARGGRGRTWPLEASSSPRSPPWRPSGIPCLGTSPFSPEASRSRGLRARGRKRSRSLSPPSKSPTGPEGSVELDGKRLRSSSPAPQRPCDPRRLHGHSRSRSRSSLSASSSTEDETSTTVEEEDSSTLPSSDSSTSSNGSQSSTTSQRTSTSDSTSSSGSQVPSEPGADPPLQSDTSRRGRGSSRDCARRRGSSLYSRITGPTPGSQDTPRDNTWIHGPWSSSRERLLQRTPLTFEVDLSRQEPTDPSFPHPHTSDCALPGEAQRLRDLGGSVASPTGEVTELGEVARKGRDSRCRS